MNDNQNSNIEPSLPKSFKKVGTKEEVFNGQADHTSGGLRSGDLIQNKKGKIVSKKKSELGAKNSEKLKSYRHKKIKEEKEETPEPNPAEEPLALQEIKEEQAEAKNLASIPLPEPEPSLDLLSDLPLELSKQKKTPSGKGRKKLSIE